MRILVNMCVVALGHLALGFTRVCPEAARAGRPLRQDQVEAAAWIERLVRLQPRDDRGVDPRGTKLTDFAHRLTRLARSRPRLGAGCTAPGCARWPSCR